MNTRISYGQARNIIQKYINIRNGCNTADQHRVADRYLNRLSRHLARGGWRISLEVGAMCWQTPIDHYLIHLDSKTT